MDEIFCKYNFAEYSIMISTNLNSLGYKNPIIIDKISLYQNLANIGCWKWSVSKKNGGKSKILQINILQKYFCRM